VARGSQEKEVERYRSAARATLRQVEWCVAYLHRIRKSEIADSIDKNRRFIQDRLDDEPAGRTHP
jgi:hypothetical protein